jgi:hypothetical protein
MEQEQAVNEAKVVKTEERYMKPFGYIGYNILFNIPLIGLILMIVFAVDNTYMNRKYYAISFIILRVIAVVLFIILAVLSATLGYAFFEN